MRMDTGSFQMAPLSDFTVTVKHFGKKAKTKITWHDWCDTLGKIPEYIFRSEPDAMELHIALPEPEDLEVIMPDNDPPYKLIWEN